MVVGITGSIASGKSTIAAEIKSLGYLVFNTDKAAKDIIIFNKDIRTKIEELFGKDVYDGNVYLSKKVGEKVFKYNSLLQKLNEIVHPAVENALLIWIKSNNEHTLFIECALLYESNLDKYCDEVIEVTAPEDVRIKRIMLRDNLSEELAKDRVITQRKHNEYVEKHNPHTVNNLDNTDIKEIAKEIEQYIKNYE